MTERRWAPVDLLTLYTLADSRQQMLAAFEQLEEARRRAGGGAV